MRVRGTLTLVAELMEGGASGDAKAKGTGKKKNKKKSRNRIGVRHQSIHVHSSIYQVVFFSVCHLGPHGNACIFISQDAVDSSTCLL